MNEIVFLKSMKISEKPYTTSLVISKYAGIEHHSVTRLIRRYKEDLNEFGIFGFEIHKTNGRGRPRKVYHLNEQQATLIITYLDNTPAVRKFKKELVRQFYAMKEELMLRQLNRQQGKENHSCLTERGANKKSSPLDYLTSEELQSVAKREQEIAVLIGLGLDYERIKAILTSQGVIYQTTIKTPQNAN